MSAVAERLETWHDANQRYLGRALARVKDILSRHVLRGGDEPSLKADDGVGDMPSSALDRVCAVFGLSAFERDVLLLCAGAELDSSLADLFVAAQGGDSTRDHPTFSLALGIFPNAHWSALTPVAPLRHWRLLEVGEGHTLTRAPLRIDERVLHFLAGVQHVDERLTGIVHSIRGALDALAPSQRALAARVAALYRQDANAIVQLTGADAPARVALAVEVCDQLGVDLRAIEANAVPAGSLELETLIRLWGREAALSNSLLLLQCDLLDGGDTARVTAVEGLVAHVRSALLISSPEPRAADRRPSTVIEVPRLTAEEQAELWSRSFQSSSGVAGVIDALVSQFDFSASAIRAVGARVDEQDGAADLGARVWDACRAQSRPRIASLARRIEPRATWDDLVLPEPQLLVLHEAAAHVRQRAHVYGRWGFASRYSRGLGISLLAAGPSGTGKTMAAEVLANDLRLDLYHIDLSEVVSKYIGETEKNLARLFDAAEGGGAILLFDEADALFGKRGEVKDSHDRYANIEVSYLLQRMEAYRGLAILTTNMKDALDPAFLRRIRFVVQFPFPDAVQRAEIWRRVFPKATPTEGLEEDRLARLNLSGGNIRNVAMNAAFLAAEANEPVRMRHLARAARAEFLKLEKPLSDAEIGGWS